MKFLQDFLVCTLIIIVVFLLITLIATFHWKNVQDWALMYSPLISGFVILLGALLAYLSALKNIHNTKDIEDKRIERDLNAKRLYFSSTLESLTNNITDQNNTLNIIAKKSLTTIGSISKVPGAPTVLFLDPREYLQDINEVLKNHLNLINDKDLPDTLYQINNKEIESIKSLNKLKLDIYSLINFISDLIINFNIVYGIRPYEITKLQKRLSDISKDAEQLHEAIAIN